MDFSNQVGIYLSKLMKAELSEHLGREPYERSGNPANHRNGFYQRKITLKGIGEVEPRVPRDRQGTYQTQVLPRSKRYEQAIAEDLSLMFLSGISTRSLALLSKRLIGRSISHTEISLANRELQKAAETWRERDLSMKFVAGENSCYRLLAFISLKMEMHWRSTPVGKVQKNLPFFKQINGL